MLIAVRLILAAVFVAAAVTKLADLDGSRLERYGIPRRLAGLVPLVELVLAGLLVPATTAPAAAVATAAFLLIASALLLRAGEDCGCFGTAVAMSPRAALARNAALTGLAAVVALTSPPAFTAAAAGACAGTALIAAQWQLLRQNGRLLERIELLENPLPATPPPGAPAPNFILPDETGETRTLGDLLGPRGLVLVFIDPGCGACEDVPGRLEALRPADGPEVAIVTRGEAPEFSPTLVQVEHEVGRLYGAGHMPSALLISSEGLVASQLVLGSDAIERLIDPALLEVIR